MKQSYDLHCPDCGCKSCRCCRKCGLAFCICEKTYTASKPEPKPKTKSIKQTIEMTDEVRDIIAYLKIHLDIDEAEVYRRALALFFTAVKAEKIVAHTKDKNGNVVEQEIVGIK